MTCWIHTFPLENRGYKGKFRTKSEDMVVCLITLGVVRNIGWNLPPAWSRQVCWCQKHPKTSHRESERKADLKRAVSPEMSPQERKETPIVFPWRHPIHTKHDATTEDKKTARRFNWQPETLKNHEISADWRNTSSSSEIFPKSQTLQIIGSYMDPIRFSQQSSSQFLEAKGTDPTKNHHNKEITRGHVKNGWPKDLSCPLACWWWPENRRVPSNPTTPRSWCGMIHTLETNREFTAENWMAKEGPNPFLLGRERAYLGAMFVSFREGNSLRIIQQKSLMKKKSEESVVETKIAWDMFHWKTLIRQVRVKRGIVFYVTS